jgi:hypothetical protein
MDYFSAISKEDLIRSFDAVTTMKLTAFQNNFNVDLVAK